MTAEEKKVYLQSYQASLSCIERYKVYISIVEEFKADCDRSLQWCHSPQVVQELTDQIKELDTYKAEYKKVIEDKTKVCDHVISSIFSMPEERDQALLSYRYIDGMTWEQIADHMIYAMTHIHRLHNRALEHLEL